MTHLTKTIRRATDCRVAGSRPITIELREPGIIVLRERGRRIGYEVSIASCYILGAKLYAEKTRLERIEKKNAQRAARGLAPVKGSSLVNRKRGRA